MWEPLLPSMEDILDTERTVCTAVQCFADQESAFGVTREGGREGGREAEGDIGVFALALLLACGWIVAMSHVIRGQEALCAREVKSDP